MALLLLSEEFGSYRPKSILNDLVKEQWVLRTTTRNTSVAMKPANVLWCHQNSPSVRCSFKRGWWGFPLPVRIRSCLRQCSPYSFHRLVNIYIYILEPPRNPRRCFLSEPETRAFTHSKKATVDRCENVVSPLCGACSFIDEDTGLARYS